jgi:maltose O-acetyltransferase
MHRDMKVAAAQALDWPAVDEATRALRELMGSGELYPGDDPGLNAELDRRQLIVQQLNAIPVDREDERRALLESALAGFGKGAYIRPPFYFDWGDGITIGPRTFINSNCTMLDCAPITVGAECLIASGVQLVAATHPIDPETRRAALEYAKPVSVADGVWLGAGVIVCPGVSIGENTVVGAGAVVTKDLPAGVIAYGNPARIARAIDAADRMEPPGAG